MKQEGDQSIFKMGVKRWLKEQNLDYKWMSDQCGVSEITVRNWMSQKIIPNSIPDIQVDVSLSLSVKLSPELYKQLEAKASQQGISLGDMVARSISSLINEQPESPHSSKTRKVVLPLQS